MTRLKLAVWDMDGTIVDSRKVIQGAMVSAFEALDLVPPTYDETRQIVGLGLAQACAILAPDDLPADRLADLVEAYRQAFVANRVDPDFREPLYEGAMETLEALANDNWLIAMATGKSHRGIRSIFEMHPLEPYFDTIWCADDGPGKPDPFMVDQSMGALGASPADTVMIGDAVFDMQMARSAKVLPLGVDWGFGTANELTGAGAARVHSDFSDLLADLKAFAMERDLT